MPFSQQSRVNADTICMISETIPNDVQLELENRLEAKKAELRDLATMGAVITSIREIDAVLSVVMDMAIRVVDGEVGLIMLEEDNELRIKISWGVSEEFVRSMMFTDEMDITSYCHSNGETIILNELGIRNENGISIESVICLPIQTSKNKYGVLGIINKASGNNFIDEDKDILEMLLSFVAVAIENSKLVDEQLRQVKIEQEMLIARQIQGTILPQNINSIDGVEIGAVYYPAREVGGDFYDIHELDDGSFFVIIGDVSSKGVPAALVMSAAAGIMKSLISGSPDITVDELASKLNTLLAEEIIKDREMFITMFFARFDMPSRQISYCNAGHLPGLWWDSEEEHVVELSEGGPIIGQFAGIPFTRGNRKISAGDRLFLFTDGLTEAEDCDGNMFGRERAEQVFAKERDTSADEFCKRVKQWIDRFAEGASEESHDDFTVLEVRVES